MMTELKLHTYGEKLIVSEKVTIASGDINSAAIAVEFDECWDNYPARTAIFKNDKVTGNIEVLMVDNKCTIPAEVLQKNGTLKISIRAASIDGTALKTSTKIRYTIAEGASPGTTTLTPTMDLYQQYLAAMDAKYNVHYLEYKEMVDKLKADFDAFCATNLSGETVWTNPDTSAEFAAQTIEVDLSEYTRFRIMFRDSTDSDSKQSETECSRKNTMYHLHCITEGTTSRAIWREYTITDSGIQFGSGHWENEEENQYCIPVEIIGYKY